MVLAALGTMVGFKESDDRIKYMLLALVTSFIIYKASPSLGMTDIRFVPFLQFMPALIAAYVLADTGPMQRMVPKAIPVIIIAALTLLWVQGYVCFYPYVFETYFLKQLSDFSFSVEALAINTIP